MAEQEASAARRAPRAARALLLIGVLQLISIALYMLAARGIPTGQEAVALSVSAGYPFLLSGLLHARIAVPFVTGVAPAIALSCTVWVVALTGGLGSPFAPIFVTVPSASFSATGARGVLALGLSAILGLAIVLGMELVGHLPPGPLEGDALSRGRFVLYVHCVVMFVVVGLGVEVMRASSVRKLAKARDAAEAASRAKGGFLAMMSHEIRTPLAGLLGALTLAQEETDEPETRERLALATSSAETLRALLDDVLDFSRIEAGRLALDPIPSTPRAIVGEVVSLFSSAARAKGVELGALFGEGSDLGVLVDPLRLRQVLSNLVGNSVKFTDAGAIEVEVSLKALSDEKRLVRFVVRDTGTGMSEAQLARLFQPFVQVHERGGGGGTGLGLTISRAIIEQMGGELTMTSLAGEGTQATVEVALDVAEAPVRRVESVAPRDATGLATLRVLVAEDAPVLRKVIDAMLRRESCEVVFAENGQEAVDRAAAENFDLILMDVHMPVFDGLEATKQIRALPGPRGQVPIHALSAGAFEEQKAAATEAGMNGYLVKPVRSPELQALLDDVRAATKPKPAEE